MRLYQKTEANTWKNLMLAKHSKFYTHTVMQKQISQNHANLNNKAKKNSPFIKSIGIIISFNSTIIKKNKSHTKVLNSVLIEYARKFERNTRVFCINFLSKSIIQ